MTTAIADIVIVGGAVVGSATAYFLRALGFGNAPVVASVRGCLATHYLDDSTLVADCFKGNCAFSTNFGAQVTMSDFTVFLTTNLTVCSPGISD